MEVNIKEEFEKLENKRTLMKTLEGNCTIEKAGKDRPKIIIYATKEQTEIEERIKSLESQNEAISEAKVKVEFRMKTRRGQNTVLDFDPGPFHLLWKQGKVSIC